MADEFDRASDIEMAQREFAIKNAKNGKKIEATGHCLYCNAELPNQKRWCDEWCRDEWQMEEDAKKRRW